MRGITSLIATAALVATSPTDSARTPTVAEAIAAARAEGLTFDPTAVSWGPGRIDVFARGPDNALWHKWYENQWSGWENLGGSLASGPDVASWGVGRLDVFARGTDNTLQHKAYSGQWSGWESLGGGITSDPSAVAWGPGRLDVFARGGDYALWHISYANAWSGWESLGGVLASGPDVASWGSGRLDVFAVGKDQTLQHMWYAGKWSGWEGLGGGLTSDPSAVAWGSGRLDVFGRGGDNALWHIWYANAWSGWESLGGVLASGPDASSWGSGRLDVFAQGTDNALAHRWYSGGWSAWEGLGAPTTTLATTTFTKSTALTSTSLKSTTLTAPLPPPPPESYTLSTASTTPTGPAPAGFTVSGTPMVARLRWSATTGVTGYAIWRTDGSGGTTSQRTPNGFTGTTFPDTVPDPRITYYYRLAANYSNGTWGEARATFVSPPPTNPTSLTATSLAPGAFRLSWPAVAGALKYRVDGATLPNTGGLTTSGALWYNVINVPPGPQSWQVVALFPDNIADYNNPTKTSAISRVQPPHQPFLVKTNGAGTQASAERHLNAGCPSRDGYGCLPSWNNFPTQYDNVTELGGPHRSTDCVQERRQGELLTHCSTYTGRIQTVITKGSRGMKFGSTTWDDAYTSNGSVTAVLDSAGPRYIPQACLACHGGTYDPNTGFVQGATFLPIDPGLVVGGDEEKIRKINEVIVLSGPSQAVTQYITGLYGGQVITPGARAIRNYVPSGWASEANFYLGVVKKNCAMCHLAVQNGMNFLSSGNFLQFKDLIYTSVCKAKAMPHAEVPYGRFWTEDTGPIYRPGLLAARLGYPSCP